MKLSFDITPIKHRINDLFKGKTRRINSKKGSQLNVFICSSEENRIIIDFNGDSIITEASIEQEGAILVPAAVFVQLISGIEDGALEIRTMGGNLFISQGAFRMKIPNVVEAGTRDFEIMHISDKEHMRKNLISQKEDEIQFLRKELFLGSAELPESDIYKERFIHDRVIYMRRLLQIKEKEMLRLKK